MSFHEGGKRDGSCIAFALILLITVWGVVIWWHRSQEQARYDWRPSIFRFR